MPRQRWIELNGQRRTLSQWAALSGLKVQTLSTRLRRGQSLQDALSTPVRTRETCGRMGAYVTSWRT